MSQDPDEIRRQIETTRASLSTDVNELAGTVRPGNVAHRQVDRVKGAAGGARDKIMGVADDVRSSTADHASSAQSSAQSAVSSAQSAVSNAPGAAKSQTQGNPLAAGIIAFGVGWLAASLLPASQAEQALAAKAKENASVVTDELSNVAHEVGDHLKEPAQQAAESVKSTATDAAETVRSEGQSAAQDVKDQGVQAKGEVQASR